MKKLERAIAFILLAALAACIVSCGSLNTAQNATTAGAAVTEASTVSETTAKAAETTAETATTAAETAAETTSETTAQAPETTAESTKTTTAATAAETTAETGKSDTALPKITILTVSNVSTNNSISNDMPIIKALQDYTGVEIVWEIVTADYNQAASLRMAAKDSLPGFMQLPVPDGQSALAVASRYASAGTILELDDLLPIYAPKLDAFFKKDNGIYSLRHRSVDTGKIVTLTATIVMTKEWQISMNINSRWLNKLGLKDPVNVDEFYDTLVAFRNGDPNGNGQQDEVPFTTLWALQDLVGNSFGLQIGTNGTAFHAGADGQLIYDYITDNYREYLAYMNKLYSERLLDQGYLELDQIDQLNEMVGKELVGCIAMYSAFPTIWDPLYPGREENEVIYRSMKPLAGPYGPGYNIERYPEVGHLIITQNCKDPGLVLSWYDKVLFDEVPNTLCQWGIEGMTYEVVDGVKHPLVTPGELEDYGGGNWALPMIQSAEGYDLQYQPYTKWDIENMRPYFIPSFITSPLTQAERQRYDSINADISTYVAEMKAKFINGSEPLSGFDNYVGVLKNTMGVDELIGIMQAAYDRAAK